MAAIPPRLIERQRLQSGDVWSLIRTSGEGPTAWRLTADDLDGAYAAIDFANLEELRPLLLAVMTALLEGPDLLEAIRAQAHRPKLRLVPGFRRSPRHD